MPHAKPMGQADTTFIDPSPRLVYRGSMRLRLGSLLLVFMVAGCKHPAPPVETPKPSPAPTGDLLRFKANAGDEPRAKVTLLIEQEAIGKAGDKSGGRKI